MQRLHPNPIVHYTLLFMIFGMGAVTLLSMTVVHTFGPHRASRSAATCERVLTTHTIKLENKKFDTSSLTADRCDKLVIINNDKKIYQLAVGSHDNHTPYPGFKEKPLKPTEESLVVLAEAGEFTIHDHLHEASKVNLTIR